MLWMRSSLVVRASDCQCTSCNGPGFDPSIRRHSGIWGRQMKQCWIQYGKKTQYHHDLSMPIFRCVKVIKAELFSMLLISNHDLKIINQIDLFVRNDTGEYTSFSLCISYTVMYFWRNYSIGNYEYSIYQGPIVNLAASKIDRSKFYYCEKSVNLHICYLICWLLTAKFSTH